MTRAIVLIALLALAGCNLPPRAATYFKAHPDEAAQVVADCAAGTRRGAECDNAKAGQAQIQSDARLNLYKKSF